MTTMAVNPATLLTDEMLQRFDERAPVYDRENRFFDEDFEELLQSGYLNAALPEEYGGAGLNLAEVMKLQRKLAYHAPATAIAVNMHFYWTGLAADMVRMGDESVRWILEEASRGHIFAAGHGESGNDVPILLSTTRAERVEGGWKFYGHKIFGSLSPVWTYLGLHGMDTSDPENPKVVHAFLARDAEDYRIVETWDTLGMRATQSHDTILEGAFVPDDRIALVCPPGEAGAGLFHVAHQRLGAPRLRRRLRRHRPSRLRHDGRVGEEAHFDRPDAADGLPPRAAARGRPHAAGSRIAGRAPQQRVQRLGRRASGPRATCSSRSSPPSTWSLLRVGRWWTPPSSCPVAAASSSASRMEQLFRDARLGRIHPANSMLTHEVLAKASLGISGDESPRWG